jgi:DNA mismatch repair ATPase MutS
MPRKKINNNIPIRIFQGGSTGLVQQKSKSYPPKRKPTEYVYLSIKKQIKDKYDIDLVLIAGGPGFNAFEEDAKLMNKEFGHKIHDQGGIAPYNITTFPYVAKKSMIKKIEEKSIKYVILSVVDHDNVIREIVESSDKKLIGLPF